MMTGPQVESRYCVALSFACNNEVTVFSLRVWVSFRGKENVAHGDNHINSMTMQKAVELCIVKRQTVWCVNHTESMSLFGRECRPPCQGSPGLAS